MTKYAFSAVDTVDRLADRKDIASQMPPINLAPAIPKAFSGGPGLTWSNLQKIGHLKQKTKIIVRRQRKNKE